MRLGSLFANAGSMLALLFALNPPDRGEANPFIKDPGYRLDTAPGRARRGAIMAMTMGILNEGSYPPSRKPLIRGGNGKLKGRRNHRASLRALG